MPNLGDYIGLLLSEITIARMHADLETIRVAELYLSNPLLRNMPVPHFRLPTVEVDVPVVIKKMEEPTPGKPPRGMPTLSDSRKTFDTVLTKWLGKERLRLSPAHKRKLKSALDEKIAEITQPLEVAIDVKRVTEELSSEVMKTLRKPGGPIANKEQPLAMEMEYRLKVKARTELLKLRKPFPRLQALVTTAEIREAGPSETITQIHLKITEEAFEWTTVESESGKKNLLVPE